MHESSLTDGAPHNHTLLPAPQAEANQPVSENAGLGSAGAGATPVAEATSEDRRSAPRRRRSIMVLVSDATCWDGPFRGWVMDRSVGGLGLHLDHAVEAGTVLMVRPAHVPAKVPWVEVRVKNARRQEETWHLGCEFIRTPPWEVLMLFG